LFASALIATASGSACAIDDTESASPTMSEHTPRRDRRCDELVSWLRSRVVEILIDTADEQRGDLMLQ
jgi:hypothetical protein